METQHGMHGQAALIGMEMQRVHAENTYSMNMQLEHAA
jgi:hypothetical protein